MRHKIARWMYRRGWTIGRHTGGLLHRVHDILRRRSRWYVWGYTAMTLLGRYDTGTWGVPRPRDMWFRKNRFDNKFETTTDYAVVRDTNDGEWSVFDSQNDGFEIIIGWWPHPDSDGRIAYRSLDGRDEIALFRRWLVWDAWIKAEWFGLRRWLYYRALHNTIDPFVPFACRARPGRNSGGYDHWRCQRRPHRTGQHRYNGMAWETFGPVHTTQSEAS